ncbi:MAG: hypothetical protein RR686_18870 [Morganella sp. (in: enterobacteria)]
MGLNITGGDIDVNTAGDSKITSGDIGMILKGIYFYNVVNIRCGTHDLGEFQAQKSPRGEGWGVSLMGS